MNISEQSTNEKEDVMTNNIQSQELNVLTKMFAKFDKVVQLCHQCPGDISSKSYRKQKTLHKNQNNQSKNLNPFKTLKFLEQKGMLSNFNNLFYI